MDVLQQRGVRLSDAVDGLRWIGGNEEIVLLDGIAYPINSFLALGDGHRLALCHGVNRGPVRVLRDIISRYAAR